MKKIIIAILLILCAIPFAFIGLGALLFAALWCLLRKRSMGAFYANKVIAQRGTV